MLKAKFSVVEFIYLKVFIFRKHRLKQLMTTNLSTINLNDETSSNAIAIRQLTLKQKR